jgi:hypothetical protein
MVVMMPDRRPANPGEAAVWDCLRTLGPDWYVLHGVEWVGERGPGEADFIVMHRDHGALVIECKGGNVRVRDGEWQREEARRWVPLEPNPVNQARRSRGWLLRRLESQIAGLRNFRVGMSVALPDVAQGPGAGEFRDIHPEEVMTATELRGDVEAAILRALDQLPVTHLPATQAQFLRIRAVIAPSVGFLPPIAARIEDDRADLFRLTEQQMRAYRAMHANPRALVKGVAGSGKTVLAVERARSFLDDIPDGRVLFLCYNKELAIWLRGAMDAPANRDGPGLMVQNFHNLVMDYARLTSIEVPPFPDQRWWEEECVSVLTEAIRRLRASVRWKPINALVVDEAQDIRRDWWKPIYNLLSAPGAPVWAFMDQKQNLFGTGEAEPPLGANPTRIDLTRNLRNTNRIALAASQVAELDVEIEPTAPDGERIVLEEVADRDAARGRTLAIVTELIEKHGLQPQQVALLSPQRLENGPLSNHRVIAGVELSSDTTSWRANRSILCTTPQSFKGLEADVVVLFGFANYFQGFGSMHLYVAMTRARTRLYVVCSGSNGARIVREAIAVAEKTLPAR